MNRIAVERWTRLLESTVYSDIGSIGAVANFFQATEPQDWRHFSDFVQGMSDQSQSLVAVQWMEKIDSTNLQEHLRRINRQFPQANLFTTTEDDEVIVSPSDLKGSEIYVATDVYPRTEANLKVLGFFSEKERFTRVVKSISVSREASISDMVTLLQDDIHNKEAADGFLVYSPVFNYPDSSLLKGIVIGVVRASVYFDFLIAQTMRNDNIQVQIRDKGFNAEEDPILYQSDGWDLSYSYQLSQKVQFPNRHWQLEFRFSDVVTESDKISLIFIGMSGFVISFLIASIVNKSINQREVLRHELKKRTRELNYLVNHDPSTDTLNRRAFNRDFERFVSEESGFSLVTFDIDNFKVINDIYGHPVGDAALSHIALKVAEELGSQGNLYRVGGDEFYIICQLTDIKHLAEYAEKVRLAVAENPLTTDIEIPLTVSIGAAVWTGQDSEQFIQQVDLQLYKSKEFGRNRVSVLGDSEDIS
ncbi:sensor domain-containing diguanylate cyclase [Vibrio sp. SCSIO 43137]|uniref:sensor domain-containing diguanylate cyclase n=1 Tax=Vibrio sp. SCSIO 43137 TaxID=3021011 RepID=UPI002306E15A|nr:sensor domain-containing diguanylate cyclase [Vibrio sp. SCSIO 43137]WCE28324.1 sensor domain-containing diguanylate cyclase [Vibrio sp. SCSIO 43137]